MAKNTVLIKMIEDIFDENEEVVLTMLYEKALELRGDKEVSKTKHAVRSILYNMKKKRRNNICCPFEIPKDY